jgi:SWI/SNF-related matrix-associated actin-dependent regulator 1 of chromatin subfamily A
VLDILEWFLHERGLTYVRLDGSTAVADRLTIVDTFNDPNGGVFAFLLSTRAGGQGLNLTGADTVILHDVDFNPQVGEGVQGGEQHSGGEGAATQ